MGRFYLNLVLSPVLLQLVGTSVKKQEKEESRAEAGNQFIQHHVSAEGYSWRYWVQTKC